MRSSKSKHGASKMTSKRGQCPRIPEEQKIYTTEVFNANYNPSEFKNTEAMKKKWIEIANEFYIEKGRGIYITDLKKSTFYDLKRDFKLMTPLQAKRYTPRNHNILNHENSIRECAQGIISTEDSTLTSDQNDAGEDIPLSETRIELSERVIKVKKAITKVAVIYESFNVEFKIPISKEEIIDMENDSLSRFSVAARKAEFESLVELENY